VVVLGVASPTRKYKDTHREKSAVVMSPAVLNSLMQGERVLQWNILETMLNTATVKKRKKIRAAGADSQHDLDTRKMLKFANLYRLFC
jgi:hypothetical protein